MSVRVTPHRTYLALAQPWRPLESCSGHRQRIHGVGGISAAPSDRGSGGAEWCRALALLTATRSWRCGLSMDEAVLEIRRARSGGSCPVEWWRKARISQLNLKPGMLRPWMLFRMQRTQAMRESLRGRRAAVWAPDEVSRGTKCSSAVVQQRVKLEPVPILRRKLTGQMLNQ